MSQHYADTGFGSNQRFDRRFFKDVWRLSKPYFTQSKERWSAIRLLVLILVSTQLHWYK
ncbi:hypothetical protein [Acidihalobacter prosperus]